MGTDVHGYVEVNCVKISGLCQWSDVLDIGLIVERNYDVFGQLFGVRNEYETFGIANKRGMPEESSNIRRFDNNRLHGHTWIYWEEIVDVLSDLPTLEGWKAVFSVMELLFEQYGKKSTRLVVCFDN
ncbi:MAG: hypothetical protein AB8B80_05610 [Marinicellaceae bacterium]